MGSRPLRVAVIADLLEESWPSMDLVADMLIEQFGHDPETDARLVRAPFTRRLSRPHRNGRLLTVDRIVNRYWDYSRWLRAHLPASDVFHIVDHSYAHLAADMPGRRVVVTCHDTDAFRTLLMPSQRESSLPRALARRSMQGLGRAAAVACVSNATRDELERFGVVPSERLVVVPNGVHPCCSPNDDAEADREAAELLASPQPTLDLLHVGSTIPRKRVDVLIELVASLASEWPEIRLVRVGGPFTDEQRSTIRTRGLDTRILVLPFVSRRILAALYRRAVLVLQPSAREGFGLPVVEALACGTPVVASDLAVLREVGASAVEYCPVGDVAAWRRSVLAHLAERRDAPAAWAARRRAGLARAALFSWARCASQMRSVYASVAERCAGGER